MLTYLKFQNTLLVKKPACEKLLTLGSDAQMRRRELAGCETGQAK